jgi:hypothetical protein
MIFRGKSDFTTCARVHSPSWNEVFTIDAEKNIFTAVTVVKAGRLFVVTVYNRSVRGWGPYRPFLHQRLQLEVTNHP